MPDPNTLFINFTVPERTSYTNFPVPGRTSYTLHPHSAPSLDEFDLIIVDPVSPWHLTALGNPQAAEAHITAFTRYMSVKEDELVTLREVLKQRRTQLTAFFENGGIIVSLLRRFIGAQQGSMLGNYNWLADGAGDGPLFLLADDPTYGFEENLTDVGRSSALAPYLERSRVRWATTVQFDAEQQNIMRSLATNRANQIVSFEFHTGAGSVQFVPPGGGLGLLVELALKAWHGRGKSFVADDWVQVHSLPRMDELQQKLSNIGSDIRELEEQERSVQTALKTLCWKRDVLLNGTGQALVDAVLEVLKEMGFHAEPGPKGLDDLRLSDSEGNVNAVLEVKGVEGQVGRAHIRQVSDWTEEILEERTGTELEGVESKGVLIANAHRRTPPSERPIAWAANAVRVARRNQISLITTTELFGFYKQFLEGREEAADNLRSELMGRVGP